MTTANMTEIRTAEADPGLKLAPTSDHALLHKQGASRERAGRAAAHLVGWLLGAIRGAFVIGAVLAFAAAGWLVAPLAGLLVLGAGLLVLDVHFSEGTP